MAALTRLTEHLTQNARSLTELEAAVSRTVRQDCLTQNFPRLSEHPTLGSVLALGLEEFGRLCEFETTALYLWRQDEECYRLNVGGLHSWCKLHENIQSGDGIMSKLDSEDAFQTLRATKDDFAVVVAVRHGHKSGKGRAMQAQPCCLMVGVRDNARPLSEHEQRLLVSFKHWITVVSREYISFSEVIASQRVFFRL